MICTFTHRKIFLFACHYYINYAFFNQCNVMDESKLRQNFFDN
jgi:hypothetical protein